jgi:hypothetical protein
VRLGAPCSGGGWIRTADLAQDPAEVDRLIAAEAARGPTEHGGPLRPDVAASFGLHRYAWRAGLLLTLPWFLERRVPRLPVEQVSLNSASGEFTAHPAVFACLPDDPAAELPGARVAPCRKALRAELRSAVAEHLRPVLAAFRPHLRRGPRTLWGMATDALVEGLWWVGTLLGEEDRAAADLAGLLPGGTGPFVGEAGFRLLARRPGQAPARTRTRVSCCLYYTVRPDDVCPTCPRNRTRKS